jgi:hypothetical protein
MSDDLDLHRLTVARAMRALRARDLSPLELTPFDPGGSTSYS